jgi:hypothetical protein
MTSNTVKSEDLNSIENCEALEAGAPIWSTTFIYGEPHVDQRHVMWNKLVYLKKSQWQEPWIVTTT